MEEMDKVVKVEIEEEMRKSYIDYAMSVIVGRALPDVRDGLKPVHRRILYAMNDLGLSPEKGYRKSATVVGEVLGKYHPHGDTAVYDAMVKMAQDFSMRYPLVTGHGNFGSVDGDSAAAMRYTEAKMSKLSVELLRDIDKETVDFVPNFDDRSKEPSVLPARYPNLLVNGSNGIAVGMATSIPPHNLNEIIEGVKTLIDNPECTIEDILEHVKGPDFPTGATIMGRETMLQAYRTGRGKVVVRAKAEIEEMAKGKTQIVVTEIPYQVNKARLIEKIADLVKDKKIEGITDLRDESDRRGMRIVIELRRDVNPSVILNNLYKHSQMQDTFSIIMLALVNGQPKVLNLKQMLYHYVEHQKDVVTRRTKFELRKAEERAHILEGLTIALDHIDRVIEIIRGSSDGAQAKTKLVENFDLTEVQAQAIIEMRLVRLTGLERGKIDEEHRILMEKVTELKAILQNPEVLMTLIKEELEQVKNKFGDGRRTQISASAEEINIKDTIPDEEVAITLTHMGYIKRLPSDTYKNQRRGGKGITAHTTREEDFVERIILTSSHARLLFFTNRGRIYRLEAYEIPEAKRVAKGTAIVNLIPLEKDEKITAFLPVNDTEEDKYLVLCTRHGIIKKTKISEFRKSQRNGIIAINLRDNDELISVKFTTGNDNLIIVTEKGMSITFSESDIRETGRSAMGVKAMRLDEDDTIVALEMFYEDRDILVVSTNGFGKRTKLSEYRVQGRAGKGIKTYKVTDKTGRLVGAKTVQEEEEIMIVNSDGSLIRMSVAEVSRLGRTTSGVKLMRTSDDSNIVSLARVAISEDESEE